jgi:chromosome segregation ATPase
MKMTEKLPTITTDQLKILSEILDRIDNSLCNMSPENPRFRRLLALSEEIDRMVGKFGLWWKENTARRKTDERKVTHNLEKIRELIQRLPEELAEKLSGVMEVTPEREEEEREIPPAKERKWIDETTYVELGEDGRLRLFRAKGPFESVLVKTSEKTYTRISTWAICDAFPEFW